MDRIELIVLAVDNIHRCEVQIRADHDAGGIGPWLGYMDWLEELHEQIHRA